MQTTADIKNAGLFGVITPSLSSDEAIDLTNVSQNGPRCPKGPSGCIDLTQADPNDIEIVQTPQGSLIRAKEFAYSHPTLVKAGVLLTGIGMMAAPAAAQTVAINWSSIGDIFTGLGTNVFPAIGQMVIGIVPTLIILAIVGFVMGFLDKILEMVSFHMHR